MQQKFEDKEAHESSPRNKTQEEIEKIEVVTLDRDKDKILSVIRKKTLKEKKYMKVHTEIKHRKKWKKFKLLN